MHINTVCSGQGIASSMRYNYCIVKIFKYFIIRQCFRYTLCQLKNKRKDETKLSTELLKCDCCQTVYTIFKLCPDVPTIIVIHILVLYIITQYYYNERLFYFYTMYIKSRIFFLFCFLVYTRK